MAAGDQSLVVELSGQMRTAQLLFRGLVSSGGTFVTTVIFIADTLVNSLLNV